MSRQTKTTSVVYADKAYNNYEQEMLLAEAAGIDFQPVRRINSRHVDSDYRTNGLWEPTSVSW